MKILYIHNDYHQWSGEENASAEIVNLLQEHGHEVLWLKRTTKGIDNIMTQKIMAFFTGLYNLSIKGRLDEVLKVYQPNIVMVQNLYPFISSSIFSVIHENKIPVVMRCPNYRLFCPSGLCLNPQGEICERCTGRGHEWHCVWQNCESSLSKSIGYAARNAFNRITGKIKEGVDCFIVQSEFQRQKFVSHGIPEEKLGILAGIMPDLGDITETPIGEWVSFVGRVSKEKGIAEFIDAARKLPWIPFKVVGKVDEAYHIPKNLPENVDFVGFKQGIELTEAYQKSRIIVVPSKWYEGFPNVILQAMLLKRPVITTKIGAMTSIIDDDVNGVLVEPANSDSLQDAIRLLYADIDKCVEFGHNGYEKVMKVYNRESIYHDLMDIFQQAIDNYTKRA